MGPGSFRRLAVAAAVPLAAGCSFDAGDWRDTAYRCGPEMSCPDGTHCSDGVCITGDGASAIDGGGVDAAAAACADNLVMNPSFETGTSGWGGVGGPITQINEGHDGEHAAQKCYDGSDTYYNVSDQPDSVTQTSVGAVYSTSAWLRSAAGQTLRAVIRVKNAAGEPLEQTSTPIILKADWQEVTAQHTVEAPEATIVEIYFSVADPAEVGECFDIDDICLRPRPDRAPLADPAASPYPPRLPRSHSSGG